MLVQYRYPEYQVDLTPDLLAFCRDTGQRLPEEVGLEIKREDFVGGVRGRPGGTVRGNRIHLGRELTDEYCDDYIARQRRQLESAAPPTDRSWSLSCNGCSIAVIDLETEKARAATCQDLRDLIKLYHSFGLRGDYPVAPQDVPPLMRSLACLKLCRQCSDRVRPFD